MEAAPRRLRATAWQKPQERAREQGQVSVRRPARQSPSLPARPTLWQAAVLQQTLLGAARLEVAWPEVAPLAVQEPRSWAVALPVPASARAALATPALQSLSATEWARV